MKLKEIKNGMVIHCNTEEGAKELIKTAYECGFKWLMSKNNFTDTHWTANQGYGIYYYFGHISDGIITYQNIKMNDKVVEFSDLVIPEQKFKVGDIVKCRDEEELTAEEVIRLEAEICNTSGCDNCYLRNESYPSCDEWKIEHPEEVIEILKQYKKDHSTLPSEEPKDELMWGWKYEITGTKDPDNDFDRKTILGGFYFPPTGREDIENNIKDKILENKYKDRWFNIRCDLIRELVCDFSEQRRK